MTLIGALRCPDGIVLLADRQETIADYAKWDVSKIAHFEQNGEYRFFMSGAGDSDTIEMVKERIGESWISELEHFDVEDPTRALKSMIVKTVAEVTKSSIFPCPTNERPYIHLIWAIQHFRKPGPLSLTLFRTTGLTVNSIRKFWFTGNPILLMRYLSDMYLTQTPITVAEAEAIAAYFLWEAKEYDPSVGKHSDIFTLRLDGSISRLDRSDEAYWEEHFRHLKNSLRYIPVISCSTPTLQALLPVREQMNRFSASMKTLIAEQQKRRKATNRDRSKLEEKLIKNLRKTSTSFLAHRNKNAINKG